MIEQIFHYSTGNEKAVEKLIMDDNVHYIHMLFNKDEGLPEHFSNSTVYMTVVKGRLTIRLGEQEAHPYEAGTVLKIPYQTKMNVGNKDDDLLELIVVKAPAPGSF
ncbi:cupin domain-containing protein [Gottschalkiaceae bacterium SANA]|nr:cupin domain-containing protein [Gottschalkiaceae bacterium SANA]